MASEGAPSLGVACSSRRGTQRTRIVCRSLLLRKADGAPDGLVVGFMPRCRRKQFKMRMGKILWFYPLASKMDLLETEICVEPRDTKGRKACEKAFDFACRYSSGRDLVEEFLAANIWPLGRKCWPVNWRDLDFKQERLPWCGTDETVPFPLLGLTTKRLLRRWSPRPGKFWAA